MRALHVASRAVQVVTGDATLDFSGAPDAGRGKKVVSGGTTWGSCASLRVSPLKKKLDGGGPADGSTDGR